MPPNFVLLDATLPGVTRLVTAMLQARVAVEHCSWSHPRRASVRGGPEFFARRPRCPAGCASCRAYHCSQLAAVFLRCRRATFCSPLSLVPPVQWPLSRRYGAHGEMVEARLRRTVTNFSILGAGSPPFSLPPSTFRANSNHCSATARTLNPIAASRVMPAMVSHIVPPLHRADT
jgi:hypothetical protein